MFLELLRIWNSACSFSPDVSPEEKSAQQYWNESLDLTSLCDELGYTHVRTVEHYFEPYGGYSPAPQVLRVPKTWWARSCFCALPTATL